MFKVRFVSGVYCRHKRNIFRRFVLNYVDDIVYGDYADNALFGVYHGDGVEVVFTDYLRYGFFVVGSFATDDVGFHYVGDYLVVVVKQQVFDGHASQQFAPRVGHVAGVNCFLVHGNLTDAVKAFAHGPVLFQRHVLDGHQRACAVLGILQNFVDLRARFGVRRVYDTFDYACRHFFDDVYRIVQEHFVENGFQFGVGKTVYQHFLTVGGHFDERVCGILLGK